MPDIWAARKLPGRGIMMGIHSLGRYASLGAVTLVGCICSASERRPNLVFACELDTPSLTTMIAKSNVLADLGDLGAGISLALRDLSPERASVVRRLNQSGIPITAWLVLPKEQGYFFNARNGGAAAHRFDEFEAWSAEYGLQWAAVGLDIEPDFAELQSLAHGGVGPPFRVLMARLADHCLVHDARSEYQELVRRIHLRGYRVEIYDFFFMADERRAHSTLLERLFGVVDVSGDRNCLMLYTSFHHAWGDSVIQAYGGGANAIVIGSTGGDSALDSGFAPLNWEEFIRDLRAARRWTNEIGVYSLEGCVRQGMLARLRTVDWRQEAPRGPRAWQPTAIRAGLWAVLWADRLAHVLIAMFAATVVVLVRHLRGRWRQRAK